MSGWFSRLVEINSQCDWCRKSKELDVVVKTKFMSEYKRFCSHQCLLEWVAGYLGVDITHWTQRTV